VAKYISTNDVEVRLLGKVRFTDNDDDEKQFSRKLLRRLIDEAEGQVERDLSPRYFAPFQCIDPNAPANTLGDDSFKSLPSTTRETLRTMCELMGVLRVLETDFGRGGANDAKAYKENQQKRYDAMVNRELARRSKMEDSPGEWLAPPLKGLYLADHNATEDGTYGAILVTSRGEGDFPVERITDPSENFSTGRRGQW
jgi:hypothetical protein